MATFPDPTPWYDPTTTDLAHLDSAPASLDPPTFFTSALHYLSSPPLLDFITHQLIPGLDPLSGRWHHLGFMVFPLGLAPPGHLRLHIWPAGQRCSTPMGGIHDHGWHIASTVIAGTYYDTVFASTTTPTPPLSHLNTYTVAYSPGGPDALVSSHPSVKLKEVQQRRIPHHGSHTIEAGIFHISTIPLDQVAATLVVESPTFGPPPRVLLDNSSPRLEGTRPPITPDQLAAVKQQLAAHL